MIEKTLSLTPQGQVCFHLLNRRTHCVKFCNTSLSDALFYSGIMTTATKSMVEITYPGVEKVVLEKVGLITPRLIGLALLTRPVRSVSAALTAMRD